METRSKTVFLSVAFVCAALISGPFVARAADSGDEGSSLGRRVDVELGGGFLWGLSNDVHVNDNITYGAAVAIALSHRLDLELGFQRTDTHIRSDAASFPDESQSVEYFKTALRLYPSTKPDDRVRPYIVSGITHYSGLDPGDSGYGFLLGPGIRIRAGEHSGVVLSAPFVMATSGDTKPLMLPNLNFFWSFNFHDGGLGH